MSPYFLFSGEGAVVVTTCNDQICHSATNQRQSQGGKTERARDLAKRVFPEQWRVRNAFVYGGREKTIFALNFSRASFRTGVQLLRTVRVHKDETVNIFSNKSYRQFCSYYKKRQNSALLAFAKILSIECFHWRGQHLCKFIGTKESVCMRKEFNSHRTGLGHQHGRRFIVLGHQYARRDVMWKHSIGFFSLSLSLSLKTIISTY